MGFFGLFPSRNQNTLNSEEREAAKILKDISYGYQNGDPNYIPDGIVKLSTGLYYLAFKRTSKKVIDIEEFVNIGAIFGGDYKGLKYAEVFEGIKKTVENYCQNVVRLNSNITLLDCEKTVLIALKIAAKRISEI